MDNRERFVTKYIKAISEENDQYFILKQENKEVVSTWHDIPWINENGTFNMVVEIPARTAKKMEMHKSMSGNPIVQDVNEFLKPRYYSREINWNYGFIPQTWENPEHSYVCVENLRGDGDPIDVIDISTISKHIGQVVMVKVLGVYALIDEEEVDWKVIAIDAMDPKSEIVHDIDDVDIHFPGELLSIYTWFRDYKIPDGKKANRYAFNEKKCMNNFFAKIVIENAHNQWKDAEFHNKK